MLRNVAHRGAFWSLIVARVVYAVNWYNIASIFAPMAVELKSDVSGLGILASSFYLGIVLFQIPGGLLAAKYGPRRTSFVGIFLASVSAFLQSIRPAPVISRSLATSAAVIWDII